MQCWEIRLPQFSYMSCGDYKTYTNAKRSGQRSDRHGIQREPGLNGMVSGHSPAFGFCYSEISCNLQMA